MTEPTMIPQYDAVVALRNERDALAVQVRALTDERDAALAVAVQQGEVMNRMGGRMVQHEARVRELEARWEGYMRLAPDNGVERIAQLEAENAELRHDIAKALGNHAADLTAETACEHDLQKPTCTVEVAQLATVQRGECTVCHEVWINPPYGMLAFQSKTKGDAT